MGASNGGRVGSNRDFGQYLAIGLMTAGASAINNWRSSVQ